jgi:preprotein translocase subunit SecD
MVRLLAPQLLETPLQVVMDKLVVEFTFQSATDLALLLRSGALPAPLNIIEERTVGPDLGQDSINAGMIALAIGFPF